MTAPLPFAARVKPAVEDSEPVTEIAPLFEVDRFADVEDTAPLTVRLLPLLAVNEPVDSEPPSVIAPLEDRLAALLTVTELAVESVVPAAAVRLPAERLPPRVMPLPDVSSAVAAFTMPLVLKEPADVRFRSPPTVEPVNCTALELFVIAAEAVVLTVSVAADALFAVMVPLPDWRFKEVPALSEEP